MITVKLSVLALGLLVAVGAVGATVGLITPLSSNQIAGNWRIVEAQGVTIVGESPAVFTYNRVMYRHCNTVSGSYQRRGNSILFGKLASTKKACSGRIPDQKKVEQAFQNCRRIIFTKLGWECSDAQNKRVLVFRH